jgi:hypothetical protein
VVQRADTRVSVADCEQALTAINGFRNGLKPLQLRPAPPVVKAQPELTGAALAYQQAARLQRLMRGRSPAAYKRCCDEQFDVLVTEIKELVAHEDDVHYEIGERLYVLKESKPDCVSWGAFLRDFGMPWGARRADEYIQVFLGKVTVLQLKEKNAARNRKYRAGRASRDAQPIVDSKGKNGTRASTTSKSGASGVKPPSACDIDWENHREDDSESDAQVRARAVEWQLHEAVRLAEEFALRRPGTQAREIKRATVRKIAKVITAWRLLHKEMQRRVGG